MFVNGLQKFKRISAPVAFNDRHFPQLRNLTRTPGGFPVKTVPIACYFCLVSLSIGVGLLILKKKVQNTNKLE